jgi:aldehyde dehydrogenase
MAQVDDAVMKELVAKVMERVKTGWGGRVAPAPGAGAAAPVGVAGGEAHVAASGGEAPTFGRFGQFADVNEAVAAATAAQRALVKRSLAQREIACDLIRQICGNRADELGNLEYEETRIGHRAHKSEKLRLVGRTAVSVPGMKTECFSGDHGITLEEHGPWGVIGAVTPVTHSLPTLANNAVNMIAAGNAVVFNPHPGGKKIAAAGAKAFNQAIFEKIGIDNLICVIVEPTLQTAEAVFRHPDVAILCVTGGPGVVAAAMKSGKRAICAGPGNPPVVVDESSELDNAARCILEGAAFDNNLLCLAEKEVFVVAPVWDAMIGAMEKAGAHRLSREQMVQLGKICLVSGKDGAHPHANKKFVGAEAQVLAEQIGVKIDPSCRMLFGETPADSDWVMAEQMMPCLPFVKCDDFEQAVECAFQAEHGFGHTAIIHSRLVDHMTHMGKRMNTTLFVKNGPSLAGDGLGGEGYGNFSIACSTGEGVATPMTFTRLRRCVMVDNLRII